MWVWFVFFGLMKIISWNVNSVRARITNIQDYIKTKTIEGLFFLIAEHEKEIRNNPKSRVTDLLKKVFN